MMTTARELLAIREGVGSIIESDATLAPTTWFKLLRLPTISHEILLDCDNTRSFIENRLGRPLTDDELNTMLDSTVPATIDVQFSAAELTTLSDDQKTLLAPLTVA